MRWIVAVYRLILTPLRQTFGLYGCCRHLPTCSEYCLQAVDRFGYRRGLALCLRRLVRCHPWGTSGWDPVPASAEGVHGADGCGTGAEKIPGRSDREGGPLAMAPDAFCALCERGGRKTGEDR